MSTRRTDNPPYQPGDKIQGLVWCNGTALATGTVVSCERMPHHVCNFCRLYMTPPPDGPGGHWENCDCHCHKPQPVEWTVTADMGGDGLKEYRNVKPNGESDFMGPYREAA